MRKESGIKTLEELRGKTMAFVDPASSSGYIYPMVLLIQRGLVKNRDPKTFFREVTFAGSHDASMQALLNGHVDAIASFDMAREQYLKDPAQRERVVFVAETAPIPEAGIAAREKLDPAVFAKVRDALLKIQGPQHAALLEAPLRHRRLRACRGPRVRFRPRRHRPPRLPSPLIRLGGPTASTEMYRSGGLTP